MRPLVSRFVARHLAPLMGAVVIASLLTPTTWADTLTLKANFGIAGNYRPGSWCPVTISVLNTGSEAVNGQVTVQAVSETANCLFARPVSIAAQPSIQTFTLYTRYVDPGRGSNTH